MVGRGATHPARKREWRQLLCALEKANRFIHGSSAFPGVNASATGKNEQVAVHPAAQLLDKGRVERRILPGEVHLANHRLARGRIVIFRGSENRESGANYEGKSRKE